MNFEFATANRIVFGAGTLPQVGSITAALGARALVVTGVTTSRAQPLIDLLAAHHVDATIFPVADEPTVDMVLAGVAQARKADCDVVLGFGGGSPIDAGKAIAALLTNPGVPLDYLEVIGRGQPLTARPAPYIAIPTTAGTGSEVTRNAVLASPEHRVKVSLRSPHMLPDVALVDPELTYSLPPQMTAYTGMDALTQVMEPLVSVLANPLTDGIAWAGLRRGARALHRVYTEPNDTAARADMALASLCGGLALANAKLGAVHGFAGPLGGMFHAPHGAICACLLPHVMAVNVHALCVREPDSPALPRYTQIARVLTGHENATAQDGVAWVEALSRSLKIPSLGSLGITAGDFPLIIEKSKSSSSMKGNALILTAGEMGEILARAL